MNTNAPSSTITAVGVAGAIMSALWAIYTWLQLGPPPDAGTVSAISAAVVTIVGYLKKETVYSFERKEG